MNEQSCIDIKAILSPVSHLVMYCMPEIFIQEQHEDLIKQMKIILSYTL